MKRIILCIAIVSFSMICQAQIINEIQKIVPSDRAVEDWFGNDLAIDGNYALIASYANDYDDNNTNFLADAGAVFVYEKDGTGNWNEVQKLVAFDRAEASTFGWSVAISGTTAVIASPFNYFDPNGANTLSNAGAAYIFQRDTSGVWIYIQKIVAADRNIGAMFGYDVSIENNQLIVGASGEKFDVTGNNELLAAGAAYIFGRNSNGSWSHRQKIVASSRDAFDEFGTSVSLSGNKVIIGAPGDDEDGSFASGNAYIFEKDLNGNWNEISRIVSDDIAGGDQFGQSVSMGHTTALIGAIRNEYDANGSNPLFNAGAAYIFTKNTNGDWTQAQKLVPTDRSNSTYFGIDLEISGNNAVIGASSYIKNSSPAEEAFVFVKDANDVWIQTDQLQSSDHAVGDFFGANVSMSGQNIMVGAQAESEDENGNNTLNVAGSAYVFESSNLAIEDNRSQLAIKIAPNPTSGAFVMDLGKGHSEIYITITNVVGQQVASENFKNTDTVKLSISGVPGIYFLQLTTSEGITENIKIIKN